MLFLRALHWTEARLSRSPQLDAAIYISGNLADLRAARATDTEVERVLNRKVLVTRMSALIFSVNRLLANR